MCQKFRLNYDVVEKTSPILLRKFLECFFIVSDIQVKRKKIYCDLLYDGKIQYPNQVSYLFKILIKKSNLVKYVNI